MGSAIVYACRLPLSVNYTAAFRPKEVRQLNESLSPGYSRPVNFSRMVSAEQKKGLRNVSVET